jgi:hypothetical protein
MTTADWALVVSICSAALSLFSLGWNVWSKWVHPKPKIKVTFAVMSMIDENGMSPPFLAATATNFGPTDTTLKQMIGRSRAPWWCLKWGHRRWRWGIMNNVRTPQEAIAESYPYSGLPHKLTVGEEFSAYTTAKHQPLRDTGIIDVGFVDVFGRYHWAPRKAVRAVVRSIRKDWPIRA